MIFHEAGEETATRSEAVPGVPADTTDPAHARAAAVVLQAWAPEVVAGADAGRPAHFEGWS